LSQYGPEPSTSSLSGNFRRPFPYQGISGGLLACRVPGRCQMGISAIDRQIPREAARSGTPRARLPRAPAHVCPADHPVCRRPAWQGADQAKPVKMQRPAGRTILTGLAWSAGLAPWSMADGRIRPTYSQQYGGAVRQRSSRSRSAPPEVAVSRSLVGCAVIGLRPAPLVVSWASTAKIIPRSPVTEHLIRRHGQAI
jgi:hypothetical protein